MKRNMKLEKSIISAATADRQIANDIYNPDALRQTMDCVSCSGAVVSADGMLKIHTDQPFQRGAYGIETYMDIDGFYKLSQVCEALVTQSINGLDRVINGQPPLMSWFPALRLAQYPNFSHQRTCDDQDFKYAERFNTKRGINTGWGEPWKKSEGGRWRPSIKRLGLDCCHTLFDINGSDRGQFILLLDRQNGSYSVLPVTLFNNLDFSQSFVAFIPSADPYAFFNEHLLPQYPSATVYLTTDILEVLDHQPNNDQIFLANLGGEDWFDGLDFSIFRGRRVVVLTDDSHEDTVFTIALLTKLRDFGISAGVENRQTNLHTW